MQEVHTSVHAVKLLAGDAERGGLLRADGEIERLISGLAQGRNGRIPADLDAASELNAKLTQDFYFGVEHFLFKAERGNAHHEHAAGPRVLFKHCDLEAIDREIIRAAQPRGAGTDDGGLVVVLRCLLRHKALILLALLIGDEHLYRVYRQRLVERIAGALRLARVRADTAADGGQRVILLDDLKRFEIFPLGRLLYVTLNADVRGTCDLAGRCAVFAGELALVYKIIVQVALPEHRVSRVAVLIALALAVAVEAGAERDGVDRADADALAAGDALVRRYLRAEVGVRHGVGVKAVYLPYTGAGAAAAVADERGIILALDLKRAVDKSGLLGVVEHAYRLFARNIMAAARADVIIRRLVKLKASVLYRVFTALADKLGRRAAGAVGHGVALGVVYKGEHILIGVHLLLGVDLLHDRRDLHQPAALHADITQQHAKLVESAAELERDFGVFLRLRVCHDELVKAGNERGDVIKAFSVGSNALKACALLAHMLQHCRRPVNGDLRIRRYLLY